MELCNLSHPVHQRKKEEKSCFINKNKKYSNSNNVITSIPNDPTYPLASFLVKNFTSSYYLHRP